MHAETTRISGIVFDVKYRIKSKISFIVVTAAIYTKSLLNWWALCPQILAETEESVTISVAILSV